MHLLIGLAGIVLILAMSDHLGDSFRITDQRIEDLLEKLEDDYERAYYTGLVAEREGLAKVRSQNPGSSYVAYDCLTTAMRRYAEAIRLSPKSHGEATLRWNTCARLIERNHLAPRPAEHVAELGD